MPNHARTHSECRRHVCLLCFGKTKIMRNITETIQILINKHLMNGYDINDERLPQVLCGNCHTILHEYSNGLYNRKIDIFDHSKLGVGRLITTRSGRLCECHICEISRASTTINFGKSVMKKRKAGKKVSSSNLTKQQLQLMTLCSSCLSIICRGKEHNCTRGQRHQNILKMTLQGSPKSSDKLASSIIVQKKQYTNSSLCKLSTIVGRPINVVIPNANVYVPKYSTIFSVDDMNKLRNDMNLSNNQTRQLSKHIRSASGYRRIIQPRIRESLYAENHQLDQLFEVKSIPFVKKEKNMIVPSEKHTVYCVNPNKLRDFIVNSRNYEDEELLLKVAVDGGGGFMKVCLSVQRLQDQNLQCDERSLLKQGVAPKTLKDSSVKKIMILAIAPDVQENYDNMLQLWNLLQLQDTNTLQNHFIATDLKLANIVLGLMAHGSLHPCSWCDVAKSDLVSTGNLRTIQNITSKYLDWCHHGENMSTAKFYGNCVHPPIVSHTNNEVKIIDIVPPPELHLLLGPMNTLFNSLQKQWPQAIEWAAACHAERDALHGGSFNGNNCKKLLRGIDKLEELCPIEYKPYIETFNAFKQVVGACYGNILDPEYKQKISNFKNAYVALGISVTPKVHAVFYHIEDFCEPRACGLGQWSEQASESVHADFKSTWSKYKVMEGHPRFADQLLRAVREYNARHV